MTVEFVTCDHCSAIHGGRMMSLCSGLGPPTETCSNCGGLAWSGRDEWPRLSWGRRLWYVVVSLLYAGFLGLTYSAMFANLLFSAGTRLATGVEQNLTFQQVELGAAAFAVAILAAQVCRVLASCRRVAAGDEQPYLASEWSVWTNGHIMAGVPPMVSLGLYLLVEQLF